MSTRRGPVLLLEVANLLGGLANATVSVLVPWLVLEATSSPADAGLVVAAAAVPGVFVSPFVGALVDRFGRRRVSMASDALSAVSVSLFPLADRAGALSLGMILALTLLGATFDPAGYTARKTLIPDVAGAAGVHVDRVNGLHEGIFAAGWVIGPVVGALGISTIGVVATFWVTAVAFVLAVAAVAGVRVTEARLGSRVLAGDEQEPFWSSIIRGAGVLWRDKPLRVITVAVAVLATVYLPTELVLLPVHFEAADEPGGYGVTLTSLAAGAMCGAFSYGWLSARVPRRRIVIASLATVTVAMIPMAVLPPLPVFVVAGFLLGLGWGPMEPMLNSLVQSRVPAHVQGRVFGVQSTLFYAVPPLGLLFAGIGVEAWGVQAVYLVVAGLLMVVSLLVAAQPSLRGLNEPGAGTQPEGHGSGQAPR